MSVILETPFATVEDTAKELGVSKARLKRLMRLVGPIETRTHKTLFTAKRRKQTRGKAKRVAR